MFRNNSCLSIKAHLCTQLCFNAQQDLLFHERSKNELVYYWKKVYVADTANTDQSLKIDALLSLLFPGFLPGE